MSNGAPQGDAADAFASRARSEHGESIRDLVVFGDAVRGDDRGVHTSVEVLLVLEDSAERSRGKSEISRPSGDDVSRDYANSRAAEPRDEDDEETERRLEVLAETVGLEHGVVFSVHVLPADRFDANSDHPFVRRALEEGRSYV
ncbi:hypothetical protein [Natrinema salsiterrestre]|uniref:Uncharacterized protein n=1 Tax=Natrinema salsiterrestre TaxID=2950540 RepID=A0A9Q4L3G6_9EURY|nr:hypothetical protein [Natrinema salsiterrestre]MDF9744641.1 hypothetical protein [Natrinema salsiterrestre]